MGTWNKTDFNFNITGPIMNETSNLLGPQRSSLYIVIPITIVYAIIFLTGVVGNVSTCIVIARNKSMHTATNYYLFSLAVSDLLLLVTGLPQEMYSIWSRYPYVFGELFCVLRGLASETSANATVLTITAFTVERYVAICHPFLSHTMSKLSRAVKLILAVWLISFSFAVPQALQFGLGYSTGTAMCEVKNVIIQHSFELSTFLFFIAPMTLITVLYAFIGLRLRNSNMMKRNSGQSMRNACVNSSRKSCRHQHGQSSKRVLKMLVAVVIAFFICWAPFHAQRLYAIYGPSLRGANPYKLKIYEIVTYISGVLYYISTTVNPVLYHIMSNKFREAFKETFSRCCCWGEWSERSGRDGSGRVSERRSCYSVLSRSGGGRRPATQESTDSGTSVTHRHSDDSICALPHPITVASANRHGLFNDMQESAVNESTKSKYTEQFNFDMHQVSSLNKLNLQQYDTQSLRRQSKVVRFLGLFRCIAKKSLDDRKLQPFRSPVSENYEREKTTNEVNEKLNTSSYDVSNSSLRDIETGALEDELTTYMKEIQRREKDKS